MTVRIGSLFAGIGGFELGMEAALSSAGIPHRTAWQVEQDEYCQQVLARHWPEARRYSDVRDVGAHNLSPVTVLLAGFPCTDISIAGKGAGLAGERSGLFYEVIRICREMEPRIVCLENVAAIHSRGLEAVLWALATLGYRVRYGNLQASDVGAPHRRERWFAVAWKVGVAHAGRRGVQLQRRPGELGRTPSSDQARARQRERGRAGAGSRGSKSMSRVGQADPVGNGHRRAEQQLIPISEDRTQARADPQTSDRQTQGQPSARTAQSPLRRSPDGLSRQLDRHRWPAPPGSQHAWEPPRTRPRQRHDRQRLKALGNAIVPQCSRVIGDWIASNLLEEVTP